MKGISAVVAGTLMILLIVVGVIPLIMLYINTAQEVYSTYKLSASLSEYKELEDIRANLSDDVLTIVNTGAIPVDLTYIVLKDKNGECSIVMKLFDILSNSDAVISSSNIALVNETEIVRMDTNGYVKINMSKIGLSGISGACSLVTARGTITSIREVTVVAGKIGAGTVLITAPINLEVTTLSSRTDISIKEEYVQPAIPDNPGAGMSRTTTDGQHKTALLRYAYIRSENAGEVSIEIIGGDDPFNPSPWIPYSNIFIGYSPSWSRERGGLPPRYNILITGYTNMTFMIKNSSIIAQFYNKLGGPTYHVYKDGWYIFNIDVPFRIKIIDYIPNDGNLSLKYDVDGDGNNEELIDSQALGYWWLYSGTKPKEGLSIAQGYFKLNGKAREVIVYLNVYDMGYDNITEASYDPYLFSADIDNNGYPEFLFITEDLNYGDASGDNDVIKGQVSADDWTSTNTSKFFINLTGYTINGNDIAMVYLTIRVYFHDNMYDDINEVEYADRVLFGIYLVNAETGEVVSSREWIYQELGGLEETYPPNKNFVILTATLAVPESGVYFPAIAFQDPYSNYDIHSREHTPWPSDKPNYDDGDFIIALEIGSIVLYARP